MIMPALTYSSSDWLDAQLLAPLDVVADGLHVDARPRDVELVEDLDGLELDDARAGQPGQDDVLGQLRVRAGGRADRRGGRPAEEADRQVRPGGGVVEAVGRQVEDALPRLPLVGDPPEQHAQRARG